MSGNTPQIVNGPRRSTRIPTKKVFTNEWITEEFVIIESQTTSNGCTTPTKEEFVSTAMNKTTDVLTKYVSDSSDNSSNKTRTVRNRRSKIRPSQKMVIVHKNRFCFLMDSHSFICLYLLYTFKSNLYILIVTV